MCASGIVWASSKWQTLNMRLSTAALFGTCTALAGCSGGDSTTELGREAPPSAESIDTPPANTEVGPVCPQCLSAGGETSDFDGGRAPDCTSFLLHAPASEAEAELAGLDVAEYRSRLTRSFETSLRWTDLTASSAQPRSTPIAGYSPQTVVRGAVSTGSLQRAFLDPARCTDAAQCTWNAYLVLDCTDLATPSFTIATRVALATADGAIDHVFPSAVLLQTDIPEPVTRTSDPDAALSIFSSVDFSTVLGTLRVEPLPGVVFGQLGLTFIYFADSVRGQLTLSFGNGWERQVGTGSNLEPIEDRPLLAHFPADDCAVNVAPVPLDEPDPRLAGRTPADALAALDALLCATEGTASWSHTEAQTTLRVERLAPEYACVTPGRINNVRLRLSTADGLFDWSVLAAHDLDDESASLPRRLSFNQKFTPLSEMWREVFGGFPLAADTEWTLVRFRGEYPEAGTEGSGESGHVRLEIAESSSCASDIFVCTYEQAACLVAPPGGECFIGP